METKERFEQQLKEFTEQRRDLAEQHRLAEFNLHRLDAVIGFIQQELEVMQNEGKENQDGTNHQEN
jgi:hypothetical protein